MTNIPPNPEQPDDESTGQKPKNEHETNQIERPDFVEEVPFRQTDPLDAEIPRKLRFVILDTNDVFDVDVHLYMVIGRKTNPRDRKVDIDLTPYVKRDHGVSRYHSYIQVVDNRISITDFNSTNGTYINDKILKPPTSYRLRHGDQIRLGNLTMKVLFIGIQDTD